MKQTIVVPVTIVIDVPDAVIPASPPAAATAASTYSPVKGRPTSEYFEEWVAAGRPAHTASGELVDVRGIPVSWSEEAAWLSGGKADPAPAPTPAAGGNVTIEVG